MKLMVRLSILITLLFSLNSCNYSLSGYEIEAKTAKVFYFENIAPIQSADLAQLFTNKLEATIIRETPLQLVQNEAEIEFSGTVTDYILTPAAVAGEDETEQTQLEVRVQVNYVNKNDEEKNFTETFSGNQTFDASLDIITVEAGLLDDITDQIVTAVFNRAFINW